jgi:hypothetical protein
MSEHISVEEGRVPYIIPLTISEEVLGVIFRGSFINDFCSIATDVVDNEGDVEVAALNVVGGDDGAYILT